MYDQDFIGLCVLDYDVMKQIASNVAPKNVSVDEIKEAIAAINRGKSEDIFDQSIESIYYAGEGLIIFLHELIQKIFDTNQIPDFLKSSLLTLYTKTRKIRTTQRIIET